MAPVHVVPQRDPRRTEVSCRLGCVRRWSLWREIATVGWWTSPLLVPVGRGAPSCWPHFPLPSTWALGSRWPAVEAILAAAGHSRPARGSWPAGLTDREVDVLRLIARGCSAVEVSTQLHIAPKTARNHVEHIYAKLNTSNRTGAALFALTNGLVGVLLPD